VDKKKIHTSWKWFSIMKTMKPYFQKIYETNSRVSKNSVPNAVFYGFPVFVILAHEENIKWIKGKYIQVGNGFQM